jgi:hypothetical protein
MIAAAEMGVSLATMPAIAALMPDDANRMGRSRHRAGWTPQQRSVDTPTETDAASAETAAPQIEMSVRRRRDH